MEDQNKKDLFKYSKFYICLVEYFDKNELVFSFVTRSSKYYSESSNYEFFDLIKNKNINIDNLLNFRILFPTKTPSYYIFNGEFNHSELDEHYKNCEEFIAEHIKLNKKAVNENFKRWKEMEFFDLKEECIEKLFFVPESSDREKLLKEMKARLKYLQTVVDGGVTSKLLSILEITEDKLYTNDIRVIEDCKKKWKGVIAFYANKAFKQLDEEIKNETSKEEQIDLNIEVKEIKNLIIEMSNEIDDKKFDTPLEVASFWPTLLRPSPVYVLNQK